MPLAMFFDVNDSRFVSNVPNIKGPFQFAFKVAKTVVDGFDSNV